MNENNKTLITSVKDALAEAIKTISTVQVALLNQANTEKAALLALLAEIRETRETTILFGDVVGEAGNALLDAADFSYDIAGKMSYITDNIQEIPVAGYQDFVEFCDQCGEEITVNDQFTINNGEFVCAKCLGDEDTEDEDDAEDDTEDVEDEVIEDENSDEDEDEDDGQLEFDLAETVNE